MQKVLVLVTVVIALGGAVTYVRSTPLVTDAPEAEQTTQATYVSSNEGACPFAGDRDNCATKADCPPKTACPKMASSHCGMTASAGACPQGEAQNTLDEQRAFELELQWAAYAAWGMDESYAVLFNPTVFAAAPAPQERTFSYEEVWGTSAPQQVAAVGVAPEG